MASPLPPPPPSPLVARPAVRDADPLPSDRPCRGGIDRVLDARDDPAAAAAEQEKIMDADAEGSKRSNPVFIMDSGASCHVASDKWLFTKLDAAAAPESRAVVYTPDGARFPVAGTGTIATKNFHLPDVLYVPGMMPGKILVSVARLGRLGYAVIFGGGQCRVMDPASDTLIGQGLLRREDCLYFLEFLEIPPDDAAAADGTDSTTP